LFDRWGVVLLSARVVWPALAYSPRSVSFSLPWQFSSTSSSQLVQPVHAPVLMDAAQINAVRDFLLAE
jgi:hypothetical protein